MLKIFILPLLNSNLLMRAQKKRPKSLFVIKFLLWHFWHFGTFSLDSANSANSAMRFFYARRHICAVKGYILLIYYLTVR